MKLNFIVIIFAVSMSACAGSWHVNVDVISKPSGCKIEVNGNYMGRTPLCVKMEVGRVWVGVLNAEGGWMYGDRIYTVVCYPPDGVSGASSQTKTLQPGMYPKGTTISFDMSLKQELMTQPVRIETEKEEKPDVPERLRRLKQLLDEGLIDQVEYDIQRKKILSEI